MGAVGLPDGPVVKICGLTRLEDVCAARDLGVWALGFVFAPSPRRLEPGAARGLLEAAGLGRAAPAVAGGGSRVGMPLTVGVFTDSEADEIARVVDEVGLDAVQLHGVDGPSTGAVAAALRGRDGKVLIIRALPVDPDQRDPSRLREVIAQASVDADIVLLDTRVAGSSALTGGAAQEGGQTAASAQAGAGFGGSGTVFRWRLARAAAPGAGDEAARTPLLVAGGIGPDNVLEALSESGAWGVDVSSCIESSPGIKDQRLMERLVTRVKEGRR